MHRKIFLEFYWKKNLSFTSMCSLQITFRIFRNLYNQKMYIHFQKYVYFGHDEGKYFLIPLHLKVFLELHIIFSFLNIWNFFLVVHAFTNFKTDWRKSETRNLIQDFIVHCLQVLLIFIFSAHICIEIRRKVTFFVTFSRFFKIWNLKKTFSPIKVCLIIFISMFVEKKKRENT